MTFGPAAVGGPIVPQSVDIHVEGRAYLAVKFDQTEKIRFRDYEYAGAVESAISPLSEAGKP